MSKIKKAGCFFAAIALSLGVLTVPNSMYAAKDTYFGNGKYVTNTNSDANTNVPDENIGTGESVVGGFGKTEGDGRIWVDKTVTDLDSGNFEVKLSALTQEFISTKAGSTVSSTAADVVFVLDGSGSMADYNSSDITTGSGKIMRLRAMIDATNEAIKIIMEANPNNRISIMWYGNTNGIVEILPMDTYHVTDNKPFLIWGDEILPGVGASYMTLNSTLTNSTGNNMNTYNIDHEVGRISNMTIAYNNFFLVSASSGTPTQKGVVNAIDNAIVKIKNDTSTVERIPYVFLLSDGGASKGFSKWWDTTSMKDISSNLSKGDIGTGGEVSTDVTEDLQLKEVTTSLILSNAMMKDKLTSAYQKYNHDDSTISTKFYTVGLGSDINGSYTSIDNIWLKYAWAGLQPSTIEKAITDTPLPPNFTTWTDAQKETAQNVKDQMAVYVDNAIASTNDETLKKTYEKYKTDYNFSDVYAYASAYDEVKKAFDSLAEDVASATKVIQPPVGEDSSTSNSSIYFKDVIGEGMYVDEDSMALSINGGTSISATKDVDKSTEEKIVYNFGKDFSGTAVLHKPKTSKQYVEWYINADDLINCTYTNRKGGGYDEKEPLALDYVVKLSANAVNTSSALSYYTNEFIVNGTDKDAGTYATFLPTPDNPYYFYTNDKTGKLDTLNALGYQVGNHTNAYVKGRSNKTVNDADILNLKAVYVTTEMADAQGDKFTLSEVGTLVDLDRKGTTFTTAEIAAIKNSISNCETAKDSDLGDTNQVYAFIIGVQKIHDHIVNKTEDKANGILANATETATYLSKEAFVDGQIKMLLGNNGRVNISYAIDKTVDDEKAIPGDTIIYTMKVHNYTNQDVNSITVSDELSVDFINVKNMTADGIATYALQGHTVTWTNVKIAKNSSVDLKITAELSKDPKAVEDADGFKGYKNVAKITEVGSTSLQTPATSNEVKTKLNEGILLSVNKNDLPWAEGANKTFVLKGIDDKEYALNDANLLDGNYAIYEKLADGTMLDSGVDITVKDRSGKAVIDCYTLKLIASTGIDTISKTTTNGMATGEDNEYIFFKGEKASVSATSLTGYDTISWTGNDPVYDQIANSILDIKMDKHIELTASANQITQKLNINVLLNGSKKNDADLINTKTVEDIKKTIRLVSEDGKTTVTIDTFDKVPYGKYKVFVGNDEINMVVDMTDGNDKNVDIEYFTLLVKGDAGIEKTIGSGDYLKGSKVDVSASIDSAYEFVGWNGSVEEATNQINNKVIVNSEMIITATTKEIILPKTGVVVHVELNKDGSEWNDSGKTIKLVKEDGTIITDFTNVEQGVYKIYDGDSFANKTITVTAEDVVNQTEKKETLQYYTLRLIAGNGIDKAYETATNTSYQVYLENTKVNITASLKKDNEFVNWTDQDGKQVYTMLDQTVTMNQKVTLQANARESYAVTVNVNLDSAAYSGFNMNHITLKDKATGTILKDMTKVSNGNYIVQINGKDTYQSVTVNGSDANATLDYYTVQVSGDEGIASLSGKGIYLKGSQVTIEAELKDGYVFKNWNQDTTLHTTKINVKVDQTLTFIAKTEKTKETVHTITVIVKKDNQDWVNHGKKITLKDQDGNEVTNLSNVKDGKYKVIVDGVDIQKTITVNGEDGSFVLDYFTLTLGMKDGIDNVVGGGVYLKGTKVTIHALVKKGYEFTGWTGSLSLKSNENTITIDGSVILDANAKIVVTGGSSDTPRTGDTALPGLMMLLFIDSALILGVLYMKRKKEI